MTLISSVPSADGLKLAMDSNGGRRNPAARRALTRAWAPALLAALALLVPAPGDSPAAATAKPKKMKKVEKGTGMRLVASDTAATESPIPFWGKIDCQNDTRQSRIENGGDAWPTATSAPQGNTSFRRLTVLDGDDYWGERCEIGFNSHRGRVAFYREGKRRITYMSIRLPSNFPVGTINWQDVMQMKQSGKSDNSGGLPVLSLRAYDDRWQLWHSPPGKARNENLLWDAPAENGVWTRFAFDVRYSRTKRKGRVSVYADLNGDRDFADYGERSRRFRTNTLKVETTGTNSDGMRRGQSIPSHLRAGIYHNSVIGCPPPDGCSADIDNVQVLAPKDLSR